MNIEWKLTKRRGNLRPVLTYTIALTEYEASLALPAVRVESTLPKPPDAGWIHCWPGQNERAAGWSPREFYLLLSPSYRDVRATGELKLPWRADGEYPEVAESFEYLRAAFEEVLAASTASGPLDMQGYLETSAQARKIIARDVAARRLMRSMGKAC